VFATGDSPDILIPKVVDWFKEQQKRERLSTIGIASFGPVDLVKGSSTYGHITSTPKHGWKNTDPGGDQVKKSLESDLSWPKGPGFSPDSWCLSHYVSKVTMFLNHCDFF
jgi:hypothetical protein